MEEMVEVFDVIVIGGGVMGSSTAYQTAKRGLKTLLLEQFDFLHHRGSSHGESRTICAAYAEDYYSSMVVESSRLWEEVEAEIGYKVYFKATHLDMGPSHSKSLTAAINSCRKNSISVRVLNQSEVLDQFSGKFQLPEGWIGVVTELGGVIKPTKAVAMFQTLSVQHGAVLKDNVEVINIKKDEENSEILVFTKNDQVLRSRKCVITVGAWMRNLIKQVRGLIIPIQPLEATVLYWKIAEGHEDKFTIESGFPTFGSHGEPQIYGTPSLEFPGLIKIPVHGGRACETTERTWAPQPVMVDALKRWIKDTFGGLVDFKEPVITQSCMYSMTPDENFVIDFLGGAFGEDVVIAGGFSGHGFKMAPVVGRIVADLVAKGVAERVDLKHFRIGRFEGNSEGTVKEERSAHNPSIFEIPCKFPHKHQGVCSMASKKRSRHASSTSQIPSAQARREDPIHFKDDSQRKRYAILAKRPLNVSYYFDTNSLTTLGIEADVMRLVNNINWNFFVSLIPRVYSTLTFEFLSSFSFIMRSDIEAELGTAKFRLKGVDYELSLSEINTMFGFDNEGHTFYPPSFKDISVWRQISTENEYSARMSKSSQLISHSHRYIHRFIAHSLLGRGESTGVVGKSELFILWCMEKRQAINTGVWLCKHIHHVARKDKGKILIGGFVTHIATSLGVFDEDNCVERPLVGNDRLNLERLTAMGVCKLVDGQYYLLDAQGNTIPVSKTRLQLIGDPQLQSGNETQDTYNDRPNSPQPTASTSHASHDILLQVLHRLDSIDSNIHQLNDRMNSFELQFQQFTQMHGQPPAGHD